MATRVSHCAKQRFDAVAVWRRLAEASNQPLRAETADISLCRQVAAAVRESIAVADVVLQSLRREAD